MNISKLNPIGYEARTEQGNQYKKSNMFATTGLITMAAPTVIAKVCDKNPKVQNWARIFSMGELKNLFPKMSSKALKAVYVVGVALDLACGIACGHILDNAINKNRAKLADKKAAKESANIDANV